MLNIVYHPFIFNRWPFFQLIELFHHWTAPLVPKKKMIFRSPHLQQLYHRFYLIDELFFNWKYCSIIELLNTACPIGTQKDNDILITALAQVVRLALVRNLTRKISSNTRHDEMIDIMSSDLILGWCVNSAFTFMPCHLCHLCHLWGWEWLTWLMKVIDKYQSKKMQIITSAFFYHR